MKIVQTIAQVQAYVAQQKHNQQSIGFVPTMGALHKGHMSLIQASKQDNDVTIMSIYVNPTQFGPQEDLASYFRPIKKDTRMAQDSGVDLLFLPSDAMMYNDLQSISVVEKKISHVLCGAFRPGHFDGVCTVVSKLLHIVTPHRLYLGMKDAQQLRIIQNMVDALFFPVEVVPAMTIREQDGLACSSRNSYLSQEERSIAPVIFQALCQAEAMFLAGQRCADKVIEAASRHIQKQPSCHIQYISLLDWHTFQHKKHIEAQSILAVACQLGKTRLIDNIFLSV